MKQPNLLGELRAIPGGEMPTVFARGIHPLKLGIFEDMIARYPDANPDHLSAWLKLWTQKLALFHPYESRLSRNVR